MAQILIDDADGTVLAAHDAQRVGWGRSRVYGPTSYPHVERYLAALADAAREARGVYLTRREAARATFRAAYPNGLLPDEPGEREAAPIARVGRSAADAKRPPVVAVPIARGASGSVDDPR